MSSLQQLVLASGNAGKLSEFSKLLEPCGFEVLSQKQFSVTEAEENGLSFIENAIIKARNACAQTGLPALADDSGLEVAALNGAPGIYSARYSGSDATDADNNVLLLKNMAGLKEAQRSARFVCALAFMRHENDPTPIVVQGFWQGRILEQPAGCDGFGYDPLFFVPEKNCASAELDKAEKNAISHRAQAMKQLLTQLNKEY